MLYGVNLGLMLEEPVVASRSMTVFRPFSFVEYFFVSLFFVRE